MVFKKVLLGILFISVLVFLICGCEVKAIDTSGVLSNHKCRPYATTVCDGDTLVDYQKTASCEIETREFLCTFKCAGGKCVSEEYWNERVVV